MIKRYALSREYRGNIGSPAITEQPEGAYVLYEDYAAVFDELRAEKAGLEAIVAGQAGEIGRLRELLESLVTDIDGLVSESEGVAGLHHNGDLAPWDELMPGGRFERLSSLDAARAALSGESNG